MKNYPMNRRFLLAFPALVSFLSPAVSGTSLQSDAKPPAVSKVIDFLGKLLSKSKSEGEAESKLFAKFKCYCDDNTKSKTSEIKEATESISKLGSEIEGLQADNGELSTQCAKLKSSIEDNAASQKQAKAIRSKASKDFKEASTDMQKAMGQMAAAIEILGKVGADQTKGAGADHEKFMAGYKQKKKRASSLLKIDEDVHNALEAAAALLPEEQRSQVSSLLQGPLNGAYTSQSASVIGILKNMRDTFASNLKDAEDAEEQDAKAHTKLMKNLEGMEKQMKQAYDEKQEDLGENDATLGAKRQALKSAEESKDSAQDFLDKMLPICKKKSTEFDARKQLRANEEASVAEAMSILNSDVFKAFVQTGVDESFLQVRSRQGASLSHIRLTWKVQKILMDAASNDNRLVKVANLLQIGNPFPAVLKEITKMESLIDEEQSADEERHKFCKDETDGGKKKLKAANDEIDATQNALDKLDETINKAQTGLKAQTKALEKAMQENVANQKKETAMRQQENVQYQKNVAELVNTEELLLKAVKVLKKFYSSLNDKSGVADAAMLQSDADPKPPKTWDGAYEGQSDDATGDKGAIGMLNFIVEQTQKENAEAHKDEKEAQHDYEDSMDKLTKQQKEQEKNMVALKNSLAKAEQETVDKTQDLKQVKKDKKSIEAYLADIKPGCDFIFDNFKLRTNNRKLESKALAQATSLLKKSPAYQTASAEAEAEALGSCRSKCNDADHVKCKACLARTSIPGYCAGHKGTPGC